MIGGDNGWLWFLSGLQSEIHNAKVRFKAPFQKILKKRYLIKYNNKSVYSDFTKDNRTIRIFSKHYDSMSSGSGLFLYHLMNQYKHKGKNVKFILVGQKHYNSIFFEKNFDLSVTKIDIEDEDNMDGLMNIFSSEDRDILSLNHISFALGKKYESCKFLMDAFQKIANNKQDNTIYIVCLLFVYDKEQPAIDYISAQEGFRLCYLSPDFEGNIRKMQDDDLNVLFPHSWSKQNDNRDIALTMSKFGDIPKWIFYKNYFSYNQFIYKTMQNSGFYFMDNPVRDD